MSVPVGAYNSMEVTLTVFAVCAVGAAVLVAVMWFIMNMRRTKAGKKIDAVKNSHKQLLVTVTPGHLAKMFKVNQFVPGILETAPFEQRIMKKRKEFFEPEKTEVLLTINDLVGVENLTEEEKKQSLALTQQCLNHMLQSNTEKVFLEDGVPMTLALEDKVITAGVKGVGAFNYYEKLCKIVGLEKKIESLKDSAVFQEIGLYLEGLLSNVTLINIDVLRNYFDADWDQSDDEAQKEIYFTIGYRKGKKGEKGFEKMILYAGIAIGICGIAGGAVLAYLGK